MQSTQRDYETRMVEHCAPTMAGLKVGSLFCLQGEGEKVDAWVTRTDRALADRGLRLRLMRSTRFGQLIYVYRQRQLEAALKTPETARFLARYGYGGMDAEASLDRLTWRLTEEEFPHEIGIFLGYPLHDVEGFIENGGRNYCCQGCWKVYECRREAEETFARYHKCRRVYRDCHRAGTPLRRLTVAV